MAEERGVRQRIDNRTGTVGFWNGLDRYTIGFSKPGGYDDQVTGILDREMPEGFRTQGIRVVFSGTLYRDAETPAPRFGGEATFWLCLSTISVAPSQ